MALELTMVGERAMAGSPRIATTDYAIHQRERSHVPLPLPVARAPELARAFGVSCSANAANADVVRKKTALSKMLPLPAASSRELTDAIEAYETVRWPDGQGARRQGLARHLTSREPFERLQAGHNYPDVAFSVSWRPVIT